MQTFKTLLTRPLRPLPTSLVVAILLIALIGFVDAGYLTIEHFQGVIPPCTITTGCEKVLTSNYSTVAGVPVSLLGVVYYALVAAGIFAYLEGKNEKLLRYALLITIFGLLASVWFLFLQMFILHSYCVYCLGSAITSTILFIVSATVLVKYRQSSEISL